MDDRFIGRGIAFPMRTDATGAIAMVSGEQEIEEAIRLVLGTTPGERPMRPEFGCRINEFVFAPADSSTASAIEWEVVRALTYWEPRITVDNVLVDFALVETGTLLIDVRYRLRSTNDPRNLVFPFYMLPPHEGDL